MELFAPEKFLPFKKKLDRMLRVYHCRFVSSEALQKQLEMTRFERALEVAESLALHRALLTTTELGRLNQILTGHSPQSHHTHSHTHQNVHHIQPSIGSAPQNLDYVPEEDDPWRYESTTITLPSGKTKTLELIVDPVLNARERLHQSTEMAENGLVIDAAVHIYTNLVLAHVFKDANRRTAVLAGHYFLKRYGAPFSGVAFHELGLGDLREEGQIEALREIIQQMSKFAEKRQQIIKD